MAQVSRQISTSAGPDFLCIGMQKAGTRFFYACLKNMDAYRLPMVKEIHHFDNHGSIHRNSLRFLKKIAKQLGSSASSSEEMVDLFQGLKPRWFFKQRVRIGGRVTTLLDAENIQFLRNFSVYVHQGTGDQEYLGLFAPFKNYVTGDITPAYSRLSIDEIKHVQALLPSTKIILSVREPVSRLWSQLNMSARRAFEAQHDRKPEQSDIKEFEALLLEERLIDIIKQDRFISRSLPTQVYSKWGEVYGQENILVINFEDMICKIEQVLDKVSSFLGVEVEKNKTIPSNKKQNAMKIKLDDNRRKILESMLGEEVENYNRVFSEHEDRV